MVHVTDGFGDPVSCIVLRSLTEYLTFACAFNTQVIVMESTWRTGNEREPFAYIKPHPFYMGLVHKLLRAEEVMRIAKKAKQGSFFFTPIRGAFDF